MKITHAIKKVVEGNDLTVDESSRVLEAIMSGECTEAQIASLLTALRMKGETVDELTGFARVMRGKATQVRPASIAAASGAQALLDTCGTGGDMSGTFNVSTAAAFVVAGAGVRVAKHGNRSASSRCGSTDVIEALGVRVEITPEQMADSIDAIGIGFLHAPLLHTAMRHVAETRKQMGVRTVFNTLGPLTNPAGASAQLIGVGAAHLTEIVAEVLRNLGTDRAIVVHGSDGMDEITTTATTRVTELFQGEIRTYFISPGEYGLPLATSDDLRGADTAPENADLILRILRGEPGPRRDIVLLNAAAGLLAASRAADLREGIDAARKSIDSGAALSRLKALIEFTNSV
ncbi:MAG TPA: anthranilate phosphoribosyltransferase [Blastocatellia bacterium]